MTAPPLATLLIMLVPSFALAEEMPGPASSGHPAADHQRHGQSQSDAVAEAAGPASAAFTAANAKMMAAMSRPLTGDTDRDFATLMIAHHEAAIDMAKVELDHGSDPSLRALAQTIIAAQTQEITQMRSWLEFGAR